MQVKEAVEILMVMVKEIKVLVMERELLLSRVFVGDLGIVMYQV